MTSTGFSISTSDQKNHCVVALSMYSIVSPFSVFYCSYFSINTQIKHSFTHSYFFMKNLGRRYRATLITCQFFKIGVLFFSCTFISDTSNSLSDHNKSLEIAQTSVGYHNILTVTPAITTLTTPTAQDATRLSLTPAFSSIDVE